MAIPSGSGTEVLRRNSIVNQSTSDTSIDWAQAVQTTAGNSSGTVAVPANVIITILTITVCNRSGDTRTIDLRIDRAVSHSAIRILANQSIESEGTFVFSDKLVLRENDTLTFDASGTSMDVHVNYIYQDWT